MKLKLNPSGPGDLDGLQEATASSISLWVKGSIRLLAWVGESFLKFRLWKVGRMGNSSVKRPLKYFTASLLMEVGSSIVSPLILRDEMFFLLRRIDATMWKNLVFLSPSFAHWVREF